jgi:hypothetical protein
MVCIYAKAAAFGGQTDRNMKIDFNKESKGITVLSFSIKSAINGYSHTGPQNLKIFLTSLSLLLTPHEIELGIK